MQLLLEEIVLFEVDSNLLQLRKQQQERICNVSKSDTAMSSSDRVKAQLTRR